MAAPAYVAGGTFVNTATKDVNLAVSPPAGFSAGQHAFLQVQTVEQGAGNTAPSIVGPGSGWRQIGPEIHASGFVNTRQTRSRIYHRVLAGGDTSWNVQMTGGTAVGVNLSAKISTFTDVGVIRYGTATTGDAATITLPGITTKNANELLVAFLVIADGNTVSLQDFADAGVTGDTERHDHTVGSRVGVSMATATRATAGASGNWTATPSATDPWAGVVMAFAETETFPAQSVVEPFTYSDGELDTVSGGAWADDTFGFANDGVSVISNRAGNSGAFDERSYYTQQHQADGEVAATVVTLAPANEKVSLAYRVQAPATAGVDGFEVETNQTGDGLRAWRVDNQTFTQIGLFQQPLVAGDIIGVRFTGTLHEYFVKPSSGPRIHVGSVTDANYNSTGYGGITIEGTTARLDDFILGPLAADTTPPAAPTGLTLTQTATDTIGIAFTTASASDVATYRVRYKTGTGQTFSGPTDGTQLIGDTATTPSASVNTSAGGLTPGQAYTIGVFNADEVPNWSTAATASITLSGVFFTPTITANAAGPIVTAILLPGAATASISVTMEVQSGTPLPPSDVAFTPTITAIAAGKIIFQEAVGRPRGPSPVQIVGPLGGGQQNPALLFYPRPGRTRRVLAGFRRR